MTDLDPPFGTYALPPKREAWRKKARGYSDTVIGRARISQARKKALAGETGPFDVTIDDGLYARLYPASNRCEKRAFAGIQTWDAPERAALRAAFEGDIKRPFVFMDIGANVGLYSLYAAAYARLAQCEINIIAIEPASGMCARLDDNLAANNFDAQIVRTAVSDKPGKGSLSIDPINRGETHLVSDADDTDEQVVVDTMARIIKAHRIKHINAMKVDIEGHDLKALSAFFKDAAKPLHPRLLIIETGAAGTGDCEALIALCIANDYIIAARTKLNTVFRKQ